MQDTAVEAWPENTPPASFFVKVYEADQEAAKLQTLEEYLYWVRGFYEGTTFYRRGWIDISEDILAGVESPERLAARRQQLFELGRDIAAEWAKDTGINRIENAHLAIWGVAAQRAVGEGNIEETLEKISADIDLLLALQIEADVITADRYHPPDPNDYFGN